MFHRLNTDRSVGHMTVQFVPLKVTTEGPKWEAWEEQYPPKGKAIPYVYVIRADGKMLYGGSGTLPGPALGELMKASLAQSGRIFNPKEVELMKATVKAIKAADKEGDHLAATKALAATAKLGTVGDLKSYSTVAAELNALAKGVLVQAEKTIEETKTQLADPETRFDAAMKLAAAKVAYAQLTDVRTKVKAAYDEFKDDEEAKDALQKADLIQRALFRRSLRNGDKLAVKDLTRVIEQYPDTQAAERAAAYIEQITGEPPQVDPPDADDDGYRVWTDVTGKHRIEAKFVARKEGWVQLETRAGKKISLPIAKLSPADREVVEKFD